MTPCIGPVLGSILAIAAAQGRALSGASLLAVYSAGLGIPFLAAGLAMRRLTGAFTWVRNRLQLISAVSGGVLVVLGALLVFNRLIWITTLLQSFARLIGLGRIIKIG